MATINTRKRRKEQVCVFRSEKKYVSVQTSAKLKILCNQIKILMDFMFGSILDVEKKIVPCLFYSFVESPSNEFLLSISQQETYEKV